MGMFSEIAAYNQAQDLEKILHKAINLNNDDVMKFCKENIYPLYLSACSEAFEKDNETLKYFFKGL